MKKRRCLISLIGIIALLFLCTVLYSQYFKDSPPPQPSATDESGIITYTYSDDHGNHIIFYHCVLGAGEDSSTLMQSIVDPDDCDESLRVNLEHTAGLLLQKDDRSYLCWCLSSRDSFVLEYPEGAVAQWEIIKMANSVE